MTHHPSHPDDALAARARELEAVRAITAITAEITQELDLSTLLTLINRHATELVGASSSVLRLWDEQTEALIPVAWVGLGDWMGDWIRAQVRRLGEGVAGTVAARRKGLIINDYRTWPQALPIILAQPEIGAVLGEPLCYQDRILGVITVNRPQASAPFTEADAALLRLFANQAAIAIENARMHEAVTCRAAQLASLVDLAQMITAVMEPAALAQKILQAAQALIQGDAGRLWEAEEGALHLVASAGLQDPAGGDRIRFRHGEGVAGLAIDTRQPVVIADMAGDPGPVNTAWARVEGLVSGIVLPLVHRDQALGVFALFTRSLHVFPPDEVRLLSAFAAQAAIAMANARLYTSALRHGRELAALLRAAHTITAGLDLQATLGQIAAEAARITRCDHVKLLLADREAQVLRIGVLRGWTTPDGFPLPIGTGLSGTVAQTGQPLYVADTQNDPRSVLAPFDRAAGLRTYLGIPIAIRGEVVGVLTFNTPESREYTPEEIAYVTAFADHAAIAIENARLHTATQQELAERRLTEEGLRRSQTMLARTEGIAHVGSWEWDVATDTVTWSDELFRIFQRSPADGAPSFAEHPELYYPEDMQRLRVAAEAAISNGTPYEMELRAIRKDGETRVCLARGHAEMGPGKSASRLFGSLQDITERKQAEEALRARTAQLEAVRDVSAEIICELDLDRLLELIVRRAAELIGAPAGTLSLWDEERKILGSRVRFGELFRSLPQRPLALGEGMMGQVLASRQGLLVNDYRTWPGARPDTLGHTEVTAALAEPLLYRERLIGVINLAHGAGGGTFTPEHAALLRLFADHAAIAIENARLFAETQRERQELDLLATLAQRISASFDLDATLQAVVDGARVLGGADLARLALRTEGEDGDVFAFRYWAGESRGDYSRVEIRPAAGLGGRALVTGAPARTADYRNDPVVDQSYAALAEAEGVVAECVVPLSLAGQIDGLLYLDRRTAIPFTDQEETLLLRLAAQAAIAIENARLFRVEQARTAQLAALHKADLAISAGLSMDTILARVVVEAARLTGCPIVKILLHDPATDTLLVAAVEGHAALGPGDTLPGMVGLSALVVQTGETVYSPETSTDPRNPFADQDRLLGIRTYLGLPIRQGDQVVGVLTFNTAAPRIYPPEERAVFAAFAAQVAVVLANANLHAAVTAELAERQRAEAALTARTIQLEAIREVSAELTRELDLDRLLALLTQRVTTLLGVPAGTVRLWDEATGLLRFYNRTGEACTGPTMISLRLGEGVAGAAALRRTGLLVNDFRTSPYATPALLASPHTAVMAEPLLYHDRLVGVLSVDNGTTGRPFTPDDQALLRLFADHAAIALENARLFAELNQTFADLLAAQTALVQTEKLRALGQMAGGIAHDLNNKLMVILGQVELLRLTVAHPALERELAPLEDAATASAAVVRQILDFGRQHAGLPHTPLALAPLVAEALALTKAQWKDAAERQGVSVTVHTALADLPPVQGQAAELREALVQVIGNAVDAMPTGGTLTIAGRRVPTGTGEPAAPSPRVPESPSLQVPEPPSPAEGAWVEITVTDTGVGIPPELQPRLFDPFFTTKGVQRTGLGLAVVYATLQRHGGTITVASTPGQGTTVTLRLPVAAALPAAPPPAPTPPRAGVTPRRLLLIDDEPKVRSTLASLLRAVGHTVTEAASGPAGLALLATTPVDCVLTDLGMAEMTGWEVATAVAASWPTLPVLLLTGWGDQAVADPRAATVARVLSKPIRREELLVVIAEVTSEQ